jgi:hypothetical protein
MARRVAKRKSRTAIHNPNFKIVKGEPTLQFKKNGAVKYDKHGKPITKVKNYVVDESILIQAEEDILIHHYPKKKVAVTYIVGYNKDGNQVLGTRIIKVPGDPVLVRVIPKGSIIRKQKRPITIQKLRYN